MKIFLSSTFLDLFEERQAMLQVLEKKKTLARAMEYFVASPDTPRETALRELRDSDLMVLVIGFKAGSLLPDGSESTYTSAEYDEFRKMQKEPLVFVKQERLEGSLPSWRNDETDPTTRAALEAFKTRVCEKSTPAYFTSPDKLALEVNLAIDSWEARGRPGARKTFASAFEYFKGKDPTGQFQILDFETTLLGREREIRALNEFASSTTQRVCILSGRGGIGKSKILHDWANQDPATVMFLKDEPLWDGDAEKEIPVDCKTVVVDDAHRQENFGRVLQLLREHFKLQEFQTDCLHASRKRHSAVARDKAKV